MFRVSHRGEGVDDADTIEGAREIVRGQSPRRYDVDEIRADPLPLGHTSRSWGRMIRLPDGRVEDEQWPWDRAHIALPCKAPTTPRQSELYLFTGQK